MSRSAARSGTSPRNDAGGIFAHLLRILFIIFVDGMFTNLFERSFTNVFNVTDTNPTIPCLYLARNAD